MNIIDAIKSGKRFRRPLTAFFWDYSKESINCFKKEDILADDWIIEEPAISLTESQIRGALDRTYTPYDSYREYVAAVLMS